MKKILFFSFLFFSFLFFSLLLNTSCNKESEPDKNLTSKEYSNDIKNENLKLLGQAFALTLAESPEMRVALKSEAQKMFDYQPDVLFITFKDTKIGDQTVYSLVKSKFTAIVPKKDFDECVSSIKYLQLSIPIQLNEWNPSSTKPVLAVLPNDFDESTTEEILTFNENGQEGKISTKEKPNEPVIVISKAERVDKLGRLKVNKNGFVIGEKDRILAVDAIRNRSLRKSAGYEDGQSIIQIIPDDSFKIITQREEYERIIVKNREDAENKELKKQMTQLSKKINNSTLGYPNYPLITLECESSQPRTIDLTWNNTTPYSCTYEIYAKGRWSANEVDPTEKKIGTTTNTLFSYTFPLENEVYTMYVIALYYVPQTRSNFYRTLTSGRKLGTKEYVSKIYIAASMANKLESWPTYHIELEGTACFIEKLDGNPKLAGNVDLEFYTKTDWGIVQNTTKTFSINDGAIFDWYRFSDFTVENGLKTNYSNAFYSMRWFEDDDDDNDKLRSMRTKIMKTTLKIVGVDIPTMDEKESSTSPTDFGIYDLWCDYDDEDLGYYDVRWFSPNGNIYKPGMDPNNQAYDKFVSGNIQFFHSYTNNYPNP